MISGDWRIKETVSSVWSGVEPRKILFQDVGCADAGDSNASLSDFVSSALIFTASRNVWLLRGLPFAEMDDAVLAQDLEIIVGLPNIPIEPTGRGAYALGGGIHQAPH